MINMSYCRFHNTNLALEECLEDLVNGQPLSEDELYECKCLFENVVDFLEGEFIEIDRNAFNEWLASLDNYCE